MTFERKTDYPTRHPDCPFGTTGRIIMELEKYPMSQTYRCIVIDPPWPEKGGGKIKRGADRHYPVLRPEVMPEVIRASGVFTPAPDCHLYLWVTNNYLWHGLWLMKALGFNYKTMLTWAKDRFGLGYYFRGQTEQLLFGVRGSLPPLRRDISTLITARRGEHSRKPFAAYAVIESVSPGPRLEMFAREARLGWDTWGNEV